MSKGTSAWATRVILLSLAVLIVGCALRTEAAVTEPPAIEGGGGVGRRVGGRGRTKGGRRVSSRRRGWPTLLGATVHPDPYPCRPRVQSVPLPSPPPGKLYIPNCAVVKRCSGCCSINAIECIPKPGVKEVKIKWETNEYVMERKGRWKFNGVISFNIPEHTKCTCGCKVRAEHCNSLQSYDASNCRCRCKNFYESLTCNSPKFWDYMDCTCRCPSSSFDCSTGTYMDPESCQCVSGEAIVDKVKAATKLGLPDIYRF